MARAGTTTGHLSPRGAKLKLCRLAWWKAVSRVGAAAAVVVGASLVTPASSGPAAAATTLGRPSPGVHGEVHLVIWSVDSDGTDFQAILSGAIGDYGPAVTVLPDGKVDPEHTSLMELELRHGTFRLYIDGIASKFRAETSHEPVYAATCSDYVNVTATVPVVSGSGTGLYRGIRGNFSLSLAGNEDQLSPPCRLGIARQILVLAGSGTVSS
jgi:hypothetical protein